MPPVLAVLAVLAALVQRWRCAEGPAASAEAIALLGALGLGALGLLAALLAVAGWFSGPALAFTGVALAVLIWPWGQRPRPAPPRPRALARGLALAGLLAGAAALRWPPIPAELGGRDQGTYVLRAEHTLRTGRTDHVDPVLARAGAEADQRPGPGDILGLFPIDGAPARAGRYEGAYRPGFYLARRATGEVVPQFLHLHPSLLALFGLAFGPDALGLVAPLAGLLSVLALWALAARLWPRGPWPWLAAGLLALSPIAVWVHRTPLSEPLTGLLVLAAALAAARGLREATDPGLLCALLLGGAGFARGNLWLAAPAVLAVLWLRPGPGPRRMAAPTLLFGLLTASFALHLATTYPYLHDELRRQLGPAVALGPAGALVLGALLLLAYLRLDLALAPLRGRLARAPAVLAALAALAVLAYLGLRAPGPPWSRLDPALPLLGAPLLGAGALGLLLLARARVPAGEGAAWLLALATLPVTALALYAQRNLPELGLYYYGRYLAPELLPALALLATCAIEHIHRAMSRTPRRARALAALLALGLLADQALPYLRAPVTRLQEFAGAGRLARDLAAVIPERAVVIAGGEGWHAAHTFNQLGGALAFGQGRDVLPYRGREATYAALHELLIAGPAARGEDPPPVFLLLGEAARPLAGDPPTAFVDDLLPPPFAARPVVHAELHVDRLTPVEDRIPDRVTRADLRVALLAVDVDPARRADVRAFRLVDGVAQGPGPLTMSGFTLREGQVCLGPDTPLTIDLPAGEGPGSLVLVAQPGSAATTWRLALDDVPLALDPPQTSNPRARDTLGPFPFAAPPRRLTIWGSPKPRPDRPCPHGGLAELRLLGPDRGPAPDAPPADLRAYTPPQDLGHPVRLARWASGRALSRLRPGPDPAQPLDGPALLVRPGAPVTFPIEHVPGDGGALDLAVTLRGARVSPAGRVRVWAGDQHVLDVDPPDALAGAWHAPPQRWRPPARAVRLRVELVDPDPDASVGLRDLALVTPPAARPAGG